MAIEDIKSDLQSLIKLYRHLQSIKIGPQSASSEYLDEKAQIFLKDLLDGASERVFGAHSEFMAARLDVKLKSLVLSSENSNPKPLKRRRQYKIHPKIRIEQFRSGGRKRDICEKDTLNLDDHTNLNINAQTYDNQVSISGKEVPRSKAGSGIDGETERKNEIVADSMSNQVDSTIKIIDSHILALELVPQNVPSGINDMESKPVDESVCNLKDINRVSPYDCVNHSFVRNEVKETKLVSNVTKLSETVGNATSSNVTNKLEDQVENSASKEPLELGWNEDQIAGRSVKAMVNRIESMSRLASQSDHTTTHSCRYIRGMRLSASPSNVATLTPSFPRRIEKEFQDLNVGASRSSMSNRTHHRYMVPPILYGNEFDQENKKSKTNRNNILLEDPSSSSVEDFSLSETQSSDYVGSTSYPDSESDTFISSGDSDVFLSEKTDEQSVGSVPISVNKQTGRFRKLKDKLGLIFHHHHHHHHHHHSHDKAKATGGRSLWKNAGKIFRGKHVEKAVEKDARSLVHKNKNQKGNFPGIVKGVWKHVKKSRSSMVSKDDRERVGKKKHGGKKGAQKLQWWRMLQQQRAGKKMPSKPKVKVGTKNTRLRALPMLTSEDGEG